MEFPLTHPRLIGLRTWLNALEQLDATAYDVPQQAFEWPQVDPRDQSKHHLSTTWMFNSLNTNEEAEELIAWIQSGQLNVARVQELLEKHEFEYDINSPEEGLTGLPMMPYSNLLERFCGTALFQTKGPLGAAWCTERMSHWAMNACQYYHQGQQTSAWQAWKPEDFELFEMQNGWLVNEIEGSACVRDAAIRRELDHHPYPSGLCIDPFEHWNPEDVTQDVMLALLRAFDKDALPRSGHAPNPMDPTYGLQLLGMHHGEWLERVRHAHAVYTSLHDAHLEMYNYDHEYGIDSMALALANTRAGYIRTMLSQPVVEPCGVENIALEGLFSPT